MTFFSGFLPYSWLGICVHGCDQRRTHTEHYGGYSSTQNAENANLAPKNHFLDTLYILKITFLVVSYHIVALAYVSGVVTKGGHKQCTLVDTVALNMLNMPI